LAGVPSMINKLVDLMNDPDPYTREAAARALGRIGIAAATPNVINALTQAMQDGDSNVHEAAVDSITRLRKLRSNMPINQQTNEPLAV
jgi:HEAT repeat protein